MVRRDLGWAGAEGEGLLADFESGGGEEFADLEGAAGTVVIPNTGIEAAAQERPVEVIELAEDSAPEFDGLGHVEIETDDFGFGIIDPKGAGDFVDDPVGHVAI